MSKTYLLSVDTFKTVCQGALGAMTFGAYHQFTTNKIMELNNENIRLQQERDMEKHTKEMNDVREKYEKEMNDLRGKFDNLERTTKSRWF